MRPEQPRKKLQVLLRIVWDEIMLPIVNVLQHDLKLCRRSRIWLCPTAAFTSIPLHAANPFRMNTDRSGPEACLEDIYICSYTPTLSALIRSRQTMKTRITPSFAVIGQSQPGAGQGAVLPAVDSELELVHKLIPSGVKFTNISGDKATQALGALDALQQNTWVHLACHENQDHEQPYNSRFAMRDKPLTLLDIMEKSSLQAEFAFLSACHTAVGDEKTPDEAIHLVAGLQFSGFKSVIGTLWGVNDAHAKFVVEAFYKKMFEDLEDGGAMDCTKASWALNNVADVVKTKVPLEQRIVFIHIGSPTSPHLPISALLDFTNLPPFDHSLTAYHDGVKSVKDPQFLGNLPFWVVQYWHDLGCAIAAKERWSLACDWLSGQRENADTDLAAAIDEVFSSLRVLGWGTTLRGPAAALQVLDLAEFLSSTPMKGRFIDAMKNTRDPDVTLLGSVRGVGDAVTNLRSNGYSSNDDLNLEGGGYPPFQIAVWNRSLSQIYSMLNYIFFVDYADVPGWSTAD
ncbi:CHAT domain-containing protein [Suillus subluteus]|nr:CHAT domain-containing protein [Suillus subluteus]